MACVCVRVKFKRLISSHEMETDKAINQAFAPRKYKVNPFSDCVRGLVIVFAYLSVRLLNLLIVSLRGFSAGILTFGVIGVGLWLLWNDRHQLQQMQAGEEDRLLGYMLILGGVLLSRFSFLWNGL